MSDNQPVDDSFSRPADGITPAAKLRPIGRRSLLWQMIGLAVVLHAALLLGLSPNLFRSDAESPERIFERAEAELAQGHYSDAMALYQKVMDLQPKIPPVFMKAAEQHRTADQLAKRYAARATTRDSAASAEESSPLAPANSLPATRPASVQAPAPATRPAAEPFIPPELRGR